MLTNEYDTLHSRLQKMHKRLTWLLNLEYGFPVKLNSNNEENVNNFNKALGTAIRENTPNKKLVLILNFSKKFLSLKKNTQ